MKPVHLDPKMVRPNMGGAVSCRCCAKLCARWQVFEESEWSSVCSRCWLYDSVWGKNAAVEIAGLVSAVEKRLGHRFQHGEDGKLIAIEDSDRILGAIAITSRIFHVASEQSR